MKKWSLLPALLGLLLLAGCGRAAPAPEPTAEPTPVLSFSRAVTADELETLDKRMPELRSVDFSGSRCYAEIIRWGEEHPDVELRYTVQLPDGTQAPNDTEGLDLSSFSPEQRMKAVELLPYLPRLSLLRLGDTDPALLRRVRELCPGLLCQGSLSLGGRRLELGSESLSLPDITGEELLRLNELMPLLPELKRIDLGDQGENSGLDTGALAVLLQANPELEVNCRFSVYGHSLSLNDREIDLENQPIEDEGAALEAVLPCMRNLERLILEDTGLTDEQLGRLQERYPRVTVVWRITFGPLGLYSVRTDATKILASKPSVGGMLSPDTVQNLRYCTKVRYLDLGHNVELTDISFLRYMPELEVLILTMDECTDASPLEACPKLEFLELQATCVRDLRPLSGLKNLRHLNICVLPMVTDLSPIFDLELERLWIGEFTPIPEEQVEEYRRRHPDCKVNTSVSDPHEDWRWIGWDDEKQRPVRDPRYDLLVEQLGYDRLDYSFIWLTDPDYPFPPAWEPEEGDYVDYPADQEPEETPETNPGGGKDDKREGNKP